MNEIYYEYKQEKKNNTDHIIIVKYDEKYYTFNQDKEKIFKIITLMKVRINYKLNSNELLILNQISVLENILNKLNMKYIILESQKSLKETYIKYLNFNFQHLDKCENCKLFKCGDCYGIEKTKNCNDFKKVNSFSPNILSNNKNHYSPNKNNGFLLLGSYCKG